MKQKSRRNKSTHGRRKKNNIDMEKNQFNPVEQDEANDRDLTGMERWIESLTYESLVNALEFTFQADGDNSGDHRGSPGKSGSKEFDLLMEMSSLQCPDHIRQMFDGLREVEHYGWRRSMKARMETPCLFRWVNQEFEGNNGSCETSKDVNSIKEEPKPEPPSDDPLAFLAMGASSMPSDLLDILAQAGVKRSTSSLLQTFNEADEIDKAFESLKDCQDNMAKNANATSPPLPTNFRVNTHQGVSDEGSSLGRGSTVEQQNADRSILLWTAFVRDRTINTSEEEKNNDRSTLWLPRCTLTVADDSTITDQQRKTLILDTMHVASRGKFLSGAGKQRRAYMAPWFDPTQQWFSLPMYLASRFEASLWNAYLQRSHISDDSKKNSLVHTVKNLDEDAIGRVLCYAVGAVMRDDIYVKDKILKSQTATSDSIRDTLLWKLLLWSENGSIFPNPGFDVTPLLEWDTPQGRLKSLVMDHLQEGLAREAERSLMRSMHAERSDKPRLKKQKKKRPKKKKGCNSSQPTTKLTEDAQSGDDQNSDDDDDEPHVECILPTTPSDTLTDFCEPNSSYHSPQNENNSAKIVVLQVLDELLNNVFARLGLQQDEEFGDFKDAVTVKSRGEYSQRGLKTLSADDIEVATTALMSNKEGASVDAAMNLLQRTGHHRNHSQSPVQSQKLWASRSRRQTLERTGGQNDGSHLKRSKSSGDSSMSKRKPPVNPGKIYQPTLPQSRHDDILWPSSDSPLFPQASQNETSIFDGAPLCLSGALDGWNSVACRKQNETSIFTDLLRNGQGDANPDHDQLKVASSTAASIASSRGDGEDADLDIGSDWLESPPRYESLSDANKAVHFKDIKIQSGGGNPSPIEPSGQSNCVSTRAGALKVDTFPKERVDSPIPCIISESPLDIELSPSPSAPPTPPPQLSPIIVSLADLRKLRETVPDVVSSNPQLFSGIPKPPTLATVTRTLTPSLSRDDLRSIDQCRKTARRVRDDHHTIGHRQVDALLSYRNVVAHSAPRKPPSLKSYDGKQKHRDDAHPIFGRSTRSIKTTRSGMWPPGPEFPSLSSSVSSMPLYKEPILNKVLHLDVACAKSESGLDGVDDASHCNVIPRVQTDDTMTKDGATTISSVHSHPETENLATLKEERNNYRDMCLTLGAENAKLRNLLASKTCAPLYNHPASFAQDTMAPHFYRNDQQYMPTQNSFPNQFSTHSIVAMSDAGVHRVDYDSSAMSEDGTDVHPSVVAIGLESQNSISWQARGDSVQSFGRRTSGGGTYAESETSLEHNIGGQESHAFSGLHRVHQQDSFFGAGPLHGIESRLSKDITRYMRSLRSQLKKTEGRRSLAVEGITKTVKALWPRAQIKMYGSHVTQLCIPSSDMDFVISLPAVQKNAPATAPGDLEGRNAIIETNQKVLARKLKSLEWIDQRSIKVIERTAVPVIKVSTKDSRSRVVQLDLSFDAKEHHGLEALNMIQHILEQLPMVRPLVLVLKQFLLDRGLLTAYTGGLSSYCLFLMVARYCQEQAPSWNDSGSLLMGFLDFYGNFFDPRTTGISVRTRQYFFRSQEAHPQNLSEGQGWPDLTKRNSFSSKPHRFQPLHRQFSLQTTPANMSQKQQFKSGKFDPIWVEDPLNQGNNVGRNAFRIFQVQRAFSDAHRALVASLEWDINSEFGDDDDYPLLKCLLQNEDVFLAIDEPIHR